MKNLLGAYFVIVGVFESVSVFAHNGDHHGFGVGDGLLHLVSEPTHVFLLLPILILVSVIVYTAFNQRR